MLQVRDADPASDCGRAKQLFLSPLPASSERFRADASFAQTENQAAENGQSLETQQAEIAAILSFKLFILEETHEDTPDRSARGCRDICACRGARRKGGTDCG